MKKSFSKQTEDFEQGRTHHWVTLYQSSTLQLRRKTWFRRSGPCKREKSSLFYFTVYTTDMSKQTLRNSTCTSTEMSKIWIRFGSWHWWPFEFALIVTVLLVCHIFREMRQWAGVRNQSFLSKSTIRCFFNSWLRRSIVTSSHKLHSNRYRCIYVYSFNGWCTRCCNSAVGKTWWPLGFWKENFYIRWLKLRECHCFHSTKRKKKVTFIR